MLKVNIICGMREPNRAGVLLEALSRNDMAATVVHRGKEISNLLAQHGCDLLLVGQNLGDGDGLQVIKSLRSRGPTRHMAIVALLDHQPMAPVGELRSVRRVPTGFGSSGRVHSTEPKSSQPQSGKGNLRLEFFQAGADECLTLDQDVAECLARIRAVLHRTMVKPQEEIFKMATIELNLTSYTLRISGKNVPLTSKELDLLYVFLSSPNRVLSRPYLIERVWGYNYFGSPRTVDVHVRRLREKLGKAARYITTVPCVGYKLIPPGSGG